jgi:hypothetical protein
MAYSPIGMTDCMNMIVLWHINLLLGDDSVNISHYWVMPAHNNGEGVTICDVYNHCYGVQAA